MQNSKAEWIQIIPHLSDEQAKKIPDFMQSGLPQVREDFPDPLENNDSHYEQAHNEPEKQPLMQKKQGFSKELCRFMHSSAYIARQRAWLRAFSIRIIGRSSDA